MIGQAVPMFQSGNLLTKEMLVSLKNYAFNFGELLFKGYADGILSGCRITAAKHTLVLNEGIIMYRGCLYLIVKPIAEMYHPTDLLSVFKVKFKDEIKDQSFVYREIELTITNDTNLRTDEIELCRFKLQQGFELRSQYKSFSDRTTEYDTINTVYSPFSAYKNQSISPEITTAFADYLISKKTDNPIDTAFCMQAYGTNGKAMNKESIIVYLSLRLGIEKKEYSNMELFRYMEQILMEYNNTSDETDFMKSHLRRIILD